VGRVNPDPAHFSHTTYLAKTTTRIKFMLITYIVKSNKKQKWQIPEKGSALIEKTISHDFYGRDMCIFIDLMFES
jgi:hypothetical protein